MNKGSTTQCASTQTILDRDPSKDEEARNRPITAYKADSNAEVVFSTTHTDPAQSAYVESSRRVQKNTVGESKLSSVTPESKERAINAFTYSNPANITDEQVLAAIKVTEITQMKPVDIIDTAASQKPNKKLRDPKGILAYIAAIVFMALVLWLYMARTL